MYFVTLQNIISKIHISEDAFEDWFFSFINDDASCFSKGLLLCGLSSCIHNTASFLNAVLISSIISVRIFFRLIFLGLCIKSVTFHEALEHLLFASRFSLIFFILFCFFNICGNFVFPCDLFFSFFLDLSIMLLFFDFCFSRLFNCGRLFLWWSRFRNERWVFLLEGSHDSATFSEHWAVVSTIFGIDRWIGHNITTVEVFFLHSEAEMLTLLNHFVVGWYRINDSIVMLVQHTQLQGWHLVTDLGHVD